MHGRVAGRRQSVRARVLVRLPAVEPELVAPPGQLQRPEAVLEIRAVPRVRDHQEHPVRAPPCPHRRQRVHAECLLDVVHPRRCLRFDRFGPIGVVIRNDALAPFEQTSDLGHVRVLLDRAPIREDVVIVVTSQPVVRVEEHQRAGLDRDHRVVEPPFTPNDARRTIARRKIGETQHLVEVQRVLGQHTTRCESVQRTRTGSDHHAKTVVEIGVERSQIATHRAHRIEIAHVIAVGRCSARRPPGTTQPPVGATSRTAMAQPSTARARAS